MVDAPRRTSARTAAMLSIAVLLCMGLMGIAASRAEAWLGCDRGEFCLYPRSNNEGSPYDYSGNDRNLGNDWFASGLVVSNNSWSAWNNGRTSDVMVYDGIDFTGARLCIPQGMRVGTLDDWNARVSSFRWVGSGYC